MAAAKDFDEFVTRHYPRVVGVLDLALHDRELARESAQEAFTRAFERWGRVSAMDRADGWVYVTAMNVARRERRRSARHTDAPRPECLPVADGADRVVARVVVTELLETLPPRQRDAVVLRFLASLSFEEVAEAMGCAVGTVKATLHQALRNLRVEVGANDES